MSARNVSLLFVLLSASCVSAPIGREQVSPQRPTVSYDTRMTSFGTFEVEAGVSLDPGDRFSTPTRIKYGAGESTEVFLGWSPYVKEKIVSTGKREEGIGDAVFGIRHRMWEETDSEFAVAVQAMVKVPTADDEEGLGTGELDASFGGSISQGMGYDMTLVAHYLFDVIGNPVVRDAMGNVDPALTRGGADVGHTVALKLASPILVEELTGWLEFAGHLYPETDIELVFGQVGAAYLLNPNFSVDVAISVGLTDETPDFAVLFGITTNLGLYAPRRVTRQP